MRKIILSLLMAVTVMVVGYSCKKGEVYGSFESQGVGAYVTLVKNGNLILDYANLNTTQADITVKQYGNDIQKIKIYATEGGANFDKATWKFIKEVDYNGGEQQLTVKATELASALGIVPTALKTGFEYTFYNQLLLKDGRVFDPANTNSAFQGISNYNMAMTWSAVVVCPFVAPMAGTYKVIQDDWVDWKPGALVQVTDGPGANQLNLSAVWPNPAYGDIVSPLVVDIVQATGAATIKEGLVFADYGYKTTVLSDSKGWVFSCTGTINLSIHIDAGPYGDLGFSKLILKKQ